MNTHIKIRLFESPTAQARGTFKILLLKLDQIGDFVTALKAFRIIREVFTEAEITFVCLPRVVSLAESTGLFNRVVGFGAVSDSAELGKVPRNDADDQVAAFTSLLDGHYFLAADFKQAHDSRQWLDHVDAECRAGFAAPTRKGLDIVLPEMEWKIPMNAIGAKNMPVHSGTRLALLAHAIVETLLENSLGADLFHVSEDLTEGTAYQALKAEPRMKIGVSLGAGSELRKWNADYWANLLPRLLQTRNAVIVFFGGEMDRAETQTLITKLVPGSYVDFLPIRFAANYIAG